MPWIPSEFVAPKGQRGGEQPKARRIRCDQCSWETTSEYRGVKDSRKEAGVWWREGFLQGTSEPAAWCPRCASATCEAARQSYEDTHLDVEYVMSEYWMDPTGPPFVPPITSTITPPHVFWRGRVSPKAPPPSTSLRMTKKRLAALEKKVAKLLLRVAELEKHP